MKPVYVAGIDVHKSMLAVVVGRADLPESQYQRGKFGTSTAQIRALVKLGLVSKEVCQLRGRRL